MTRRAETGIERRDETPDGSLVIAARISERDLVKADRDAIDHLELGMRQALELISGREMPLPRRVQLRMRTHGAWRTTRNFLGFLIGLALFVASLRVIWLVVVYAWSLGPLG